MRQSYGLLVHNFYGMSMVVVLLANIVCYGAVLCKIQSVKRTNQGVKSTNQNSKYHKTVVMMVAFVAAYLFQWCPVAVNSIWNLVGTAHVAIYIIQVVTVNLGGVYNAVAYTVIRRVVIRPKRRLSAHSGTSGISQAMYSMKQQAVDTENHI